MGRHEVQRHQVHERHPGARSHRRSGGRGHADTGRQLHESPEHVRFTLHRSFPQPGPELGEEPVPDWGGPGGKLSLLNRPVCSYRILVVQMTPYP